MSAVPVWSQVLQQRKKEPHRCTVSSWKSFCDGVTKAVDNSADLDVPDSAIAFSIVQKKALGKELRIDAEWEAMQDKQLHPV